MTSSRAGTHGAFLAAECSGERWPGASAAAADAGRRSSAGEPGLLRSRGETPTVDADRPPVLALGFDAAPVVLELQGLPLLMDPLLVAHARGALRAAGATILPVPADLLHLKQARKVVDQVRQEVFLAEEARHERPASQLPSCDLQRLIARLRSLSDCGLLPACLERLGAGLIVSLELGDDLPAESLEALRLIIDQLNLLPAQ